MTPNDPGSNCDTTPTRTRRRGNSMNDQQDEGRRQAFRLSQALADCEASLRRARLLIDQQAEQIKTLQVERERRVTENDSEFLMRTLTSQQWGVIGRKVQAEIQLAEVERDAAQVAMHQIASAVDQYRARRP